MRVELPGGHWATLRERITYGERRRFQIDTELKWKDTASQAEAAMAVAEEVITILVEEWDLGIPVPKLNPGWYEDLDPELVDALAEACKPHMRMFFPSFEPTSEAGTPTTPSSD